MGKITVRGYAEKQVSYDLAVITITFRAHEKTAARASKEVMNQCDLFLQELSKKGVNVEEVCFKGDSVNKTYYNREKEITTAERCIEITVEFNMDFMNCIMELIQNHSGDIDYNTEYKLSNKDEIHALLYKEAVLDAKNKAENIAAALGQTVEELKTVDIGNYGVEVMCRNYLQLCDEDEGGYCGEEHISSNLQASFSKESETVGTVWIIK